MKADKILLLAGDGIGPEIMAQAKKLLGLLEDVGVWKGNIDEELMGGCSIDQRGTPLSDETLSLARQADAVLLGAVGGEKWDSLPLDERPEKGLLKLRSSLECFANLRPAILFEALSDASSLKAKHTENLDLLIVRELTGGIYFGEPRGVEVDANGEKRGFNTYSYSESEIRRIAKVAFEFAQIRERKLCSVDKANVLEVTRLWRDVVNDLAGEYPDVELSHMYVDNAAMQLVREPSQFDVMVTGNLFGDILSDLSAMLTGSLGMLPSASLNESQSGIYEPVHGSAPDIAGQNKANPLAMLLSVAMMFRYSLQKQDVAQQIEDAVGQVLSQGYRTIDIARKSADNTNEKILSTEEMGEEVMTALKKLLKG